MDTQAIIEAHRAGIERQWRNAGYSPTQIRQAFDAIHTVGLTVTDGIREAHDHPRPLRLHIGGVELQPELPPRTLA